jgi:predicted metal-dependent hydrolase
MIQFLRHRPRPPARQAPERLSIPLSGATVAITVRRIESARRMTLRIPPGHADPVVTVPLRASRAAVERFIRSQEGWLSARLAERTPPIPFADGARIPLRGEPHTICRIDSLRGTVVAAREADGPVIRVPGLPEHLPRRVSDYLRRTARTDLHLAVAEFAERVGRQPAALRIKDTRAQWGSCSPAGVLSFSWRLVLAPPFVLRYVAAHEVAHLVELNHSPAFWRLNAELDPNHEEARRWLKRHGRMLHAVGAGHGPKG